MGSNRIQRVPSDTNNYIYIYHFDSGLLFFFKKRLFPYYWNVDYLLNAWKPTIFHKFKIIIFFLSFCFGFYLFGLLNILFPSFSIYLSSQIANNRGLTGQAIEVDKLQRVHTTFSTGPTPAIPRVTCVWDWRYWKLPSKITVPAVGIT